MRKSERVMKFLLGYAALCREHGLAFGHEDSHGSFIVKPFEGRLLDWALDADVDAEVEDE